MEMKAYGRIWRPTKGNEGRLGLIKGNEGN